MRIYARLSDLICINKVKQCFMVAYLGSSHALKAYVDNEIQVVKYFIVLYYLTLRKYQATPLRQ